MLELGPGAGIETIPLLLEGHRVFAVDISPGMLSVLRNRAEESGVSNALETRAGPVGGLEGLLSDLSAGYFRGGFSTFGALNLEPDLSRVPRALARVLAPDSPLFLAILNRYGVPPLLFSILQGRLAEIRARLADPIPPEGIGYPLALHAFTRGELARRFNPWFSLEGVEAVTVVSPTHYSHRLWAFTSPSGRASLARWDARLTKRWPFRELGEWTFVTFRRSWTPV
ncbi:Methyltransferase type 11 domain protein [mine drainage metagenome]|uniref:Methyltransferase type 11 domain protein n=2 Tax=mine drainage metagenome TaxID=410659 RepID=T1BW09_9ZZZZ